MGNRYSFTTEGLANLKIYDVTPGEVWVVLHGRRRLSRAVGDEAVAFFGVTSGGRYLMVLLVESVLESNDWDIVAARDMAQDEIAMFDRHTRRQP